MPSDGRSRKGGPQAMFYQISDIVPASHIFKRKFHHMGILPAGRAAPPGKRPLHRSGTLVALGKPHRVADAVRRPAGQPAQAIRDALRVCLPQLTPLSGVASNTLHQEL
ncbi:hypothetical protein GMSM_07860 [Geomonas sp. Red276]